MKKQLLLFLALALMHKTGAQSLFQNVYGDNNPTEFHFTSSPDAYYLIHNMGFPSSLSQIIKTDLNGNLIWAKAINYSVSVTDVYRVKYDNNSLLLTGATYNAGYRNYF